LQLQSPTDKKNLGFGILLLIEHTGPKCLPYSNPYLVEISTALFGFLRVVNIEPISVPTNNLLAPASVLYSIHVPPIISGYSIDSTIVRVSIG